MSEYIENIADMGEDTEGTIYFPLFDMELDVVMENGCSVEYGEKCADYLVNISEEDKDRLAEYMIRYFRDTDAEEMNVPTDVEGREIFEYVYPSMMLVPYPEDEEKIGFRMEFDCDWEEDHGLELTVKDGKIAYVGMINEMSPWADNFEFFDADSGKNWNYADKY